MEEISNKNSTHENIPKSFNLNQLPNEGSSMMFDEHMLMVHATQNDDDWFT